MHNVVHVTHEAVHKVGGIGTVLEGLVNSRPYRDHIGRTVLLCPLFYPDDPQRLGPGGFIEYSSLDHIYNGPYADAFRRVERDFHVRICYGQRAVHDAPTDRRTLCETLLIDLRGIRHERVNHLKALLWELYGVQSHRYEHIWEFEQYVELAAAAVPALEALRLGTEDEPAVVFAHEFMGVPTALALQGYVPRRYRTLFYAHEVAVIRRIVEEHPAHDVAFYNALELARKKNLFLEQVFGPQDDYFKQPLVLATRYCDGVLAVGHHVHSELQFLDSRFDDADISLAYNGVPVATATLEERDASRARMQRYFEGLLGWRPDLLFTHVTRLAPSKALWRDLDVLAAMDDELGRRGQSAVLLVLSCQVPRRPLADVLRMEREWQWPLAHREGRGDLTEGEAEYYQWVQAFNARARNIHVVFANQFGFSRDTCGRAVPADADFLDVRRASDVEFGLSLYEPFGISPLEPLTYGGLCVISTSCGCAGFVRLAAGGRRAANVVLADYTQAERPLATVREALELTAADRRAVEQRVAANVAAEILRRLPADAAARKKLIRSGTELARSMGWDAVAERFVFPAIRRACARRRVLHIA